MASLWVTAQTTQLQEFQVQLEQRLKMSGCAGRHQVVLSRALTELSTSATVASRPEGWGRGKGGWVSVTLECQEVAGGSNSYGACGMPSGEEAVGRGPGGS